VLLLYRTYIQEEEREGGREIFILIMKYKVHLKLEQLDDDKSKLNYLR
jgi:hypothetical protein